MAQAEAKRRQAEQELKRMLSQKAAVERAMADMGNKSSSAEGVLLNVPFHFIRASCQLM